MEERHQLTLCLSITGCFSSKSGAIYEGSLARANDALEECFDSPPPPFRFCFLFLFLVHLFIQHVCVCVCVCVSVCVCVCVCVC